jgi:hypothetical protein
MATILSTGFDAQAASPEALTNYANELINKNKMSMHKQAVEYLEMFFPGRDWKNFPFHIEVVGEARASIKNVVYNDTGFQTLPNPQVGNTPFGNCKSTEQSFGTKNTATTLDRETNGRTDEKRTTITVSAKASFSAGPPTTGGFSGESSIQASVEKSVTEQRSREITNTRTEELDLPDLKVPPMTITVRRTTTSTQIGRGPYTADDEIDADIKVVSDRRNESYPFNYVIGSLSDYLPDETRKVTVKGAMTETKNVNGILLRSETYANPVACQNAQDTVEAGGIYLPG